MLVKYLRALLESFLSKKKGWVIEQSVPNEEYYQSSEEGTGQYISTVAPVTGLFRIQITNNPPSGQLYRARVSVSNTTRELCGATALRKSEGASDCWVLCDKGQEIEYVASVGAKIQIKYSYRS